jgi:hypothetical protein
MTLLLFILVVVWKPDCADKHELTDMTGKIVMAMTSLGVGMQCWVPIE